MRKTISLNYRIVLSLCIAFGLVLFPLLHTPWISDDFIYLTNDEQWANIRWIYMNWSGRLSAHTTALFLLQLPRVIFRIIHACVWIGVILLISQLPNYYYGGKSINIFSFWIIFILYWIGNPNLGQTSLWAVGAIAYLFTGFYILCYIFVILVYRETDRKEIIYLATPILGLLAGNSNENTSIVILLLSIIFFFIYQRKPIFMVGTLSTMTGALILLLAPGNRERMMHPLFEVTRERGLLETLLNYFTTNAFMQTFERYIWVFLAFTLVGLIQVVYKESSLKINRRMCFIFFFSAVVANAAFGASPVGVIEPRALNGALILFLIAFSFFIERFDFKKQLIDRKNYWTLSLFVLIIPFVLSYFFTSHSVFIVSRQFMVREAIILDGIANERDYINVPNFYLGRLYRPGDAIDLFHNGRTLGRFYSDGVVIQLMTPEIRFDYSNKRLLNENQIPLDIELSENVNIRTINVFPERGRVGNHTINIHFSNTLLYDFEESDLLFMDIYWVRQKNYPEGDALRVESSVSNLLMLDEHYIISIPIGGIRPQDIKQIYVGVICEKTSEEISRIRISIE